MTRRHASLGIREKRHSEAMGCSGSKKSESAAPFGGSSGNDDHAKRAGSGSGSASNIAETPERKAKSQQPSHDVNKRVKTTRQKLLEEAEVVLLDVVARVSRAVPLAAAGLRR